jgi:hypothetical protein
MQESQTIHLQAVGRVPAVPAKDLKPGDQLMYNYGRVYQIVKIENASPKFLKIYEVNTRTGEEYERRTKKTTLMALVPEERRSRLGVEAPATDYRAQVRPPQGLDWVTVGHGATVDEATTGHQAEYFASSILGRHGLGGHYDIMKASMEAMTNGEILTSEDGHSFRILPPGQPAPAVVPTLAETLAVRPEQLTNLTAVEVDRYNAVLADELSRLAAETEKATDGVYRALLWRKTRERYGRGYRQVWPTSFDKAERTAREHLASGYLPDKMTRVREGLTAPGAYTKQLRAAVRLLDSLRMELRIVMDGPLAILDGEFRRRGGWSRMHLCLSDGGHVHTGRNCPSIGPSTPLRWLPEVSGMEWREAYQRVIRDATAGTEAIMCTKCYPDAPTEWTERQAPETECPGSRTDAYKHMTEGERRLYSKRGTCPECGQRISVTSAYKFRKHDRPQ